MDEAELTEVFRTLGAEDPERWAGSQVREGIPQLARFLFLRQAWKEIASADDLSWIDPRTLSPTEQVPDIPFAGLRRAIGRLRDLGATREDIAELVRGMQAELLLSLCDMREDPGVIEDNPGVHWGLFETDEQGMPIARMESLHEDLLTMDPTGREMRPR